MKMIIILLIAGCCTLPNNYKLDRDHGNDKLLARQLSNLRGVMKCNNSFIGQHRKSPIAAKLFGELKKSLSVMSVQEASTNWPKSFKRTNFAEGVKDFQLKSRERRGLLNYASSSALPIYIVSYSNYASVQRYVRLVYYRVFYILAQSTSVPVVLIVNLNRRKFRTTSPSFALSLY